MLYITFIAEQESFEFIKKIGDLGYSEDDLINFALIKLKKSWN